MNVVCFSCFAPNVRTFNIKDTHLKNVYEKILDLKVHTDTPLCYLCYKRLQQCEQLVKLVQGPKNDNETTEDPFCTTNLQYSVSSHKPITVKNEIKEECFHEDMVYDPVTKTIAGEDPLLASINCDSESAFRFEKVIIRPSRHQLEKFVELFGEICLARHDAKVKWRELSIELNSMEGASKDAKDWVKVWVDKKYQLKKSVAKRNASATSTDLHLRVESLPPLTKMEKRMLHILDMPGFALGNSKPCVPVGVLIEPQKPLRSVDIEVVAEKPQTCECQSSQEVADHLSFNADEPKEDSSKFKLEIESLGTRRRCTFKRMLILDTWLTVKKSASDSDRGRQVMRILTRTLPKYIGKDNIDNLEHRIFSLCKRLARFWTKSQENRAIMVANNSDWLNTTEICRIAGLFPLVNVPKKPPKESPIRKDFKEVCEDSQRRRLNKLAQVDKTAYEHLKALADANSSNIKFTSKEISVFLNESKLTRRQYSLMRELINAKSPKALPCYQNVLAVRKQSTIIIESDDSE